MKHYLFAVLIFASTIFALPARPQTQGTNLMMRAHWDDGTDIQGTVTLEQINSSGPATVIDTNTLSNGSAQVSKPLAATTMYDVILLTATGTQLVKFPITTALINPGTLKRAEIDLVFSKADNSLQSADISVSMKF